MGHKKKHHEEHVDETWLIPYADMLTLLLALFIVLFAMSQVDQYKMQQMKRALESVFSGGSGMMDNNSSLNVIEALENVQPEQQPEPPLLTAEEGQSEAVVEDMKLKEYKKVLDEYFEETGLENYFTSSIQERGLIVSIQDIALFDSGHADLRKEVLPVLKNLSKILEGLENNVQISGHTDNLPINTSQFPSNWELSVARALNVMKYLLTNPNLEPERFAVVGYGEYRPVQTNRTSAGRAANRRVELLVIRNYIDDGQKFELTAP